MRIDDLKQILQRSIVDMAVNEAAGVLPGAFATRAASVADDSGAAGFFEDDEDGVLTYQRWFRVGDAVGSRTIKPY